MQTISKQAAQAADAYAIKTLGIPSIVLMENAARGMVQGIKDATSFTIVCGFGNNGGDGLAVARNLLFADKAVTLFMVGNPAHITPDCQQNLHILEKIGVSYHLITSQKELDLLATACASTALTIDAIFGVGLARDIGGIYQDVIATMNAHAKRISAIDMPSGIDANTGDVLGCAIKAADTFTFHRAKTGLIAGKAYAGNIHVIDIGIPDKNAAFHNGISFPS